MQQVIEYRITVIISAGAVLQTTVCCFLGETICLLLRKFSKMRAGRRRPGPQQATALPAGHVGLGLAGRPARAHLYYQCPKYH